MPEILEQLSEKHFQLDQKWEQEKDDLEKQRKKLMKKYEAKLKEIDGKINEIWGKTPYHTKVILIPIAKQIAEKLNLEYRISGPFGLNCHYHLSFDDKNKETVHTLYLRPITEEKNGRQSYGIVTDKIIDTKMSPNSVGAINDMHKKVIPLPKTIPKIIKFLKQKKENEN